MTLTVLNVLTSRIAQSVQWLVYEMDNQEMAVPFQKVQTGFGTRLNYHSVTSETGVMPTPNLHLVTRLRMNGAITSIPPPHPTHVFTECKVTLPFLLLPPCWFVYMAMCELAKIPMGPNLHPCVKRVIFTHNPDSVDSGNNKGLFIVGNDSGVARYYSSWIFHLHVSDHFSTVIVR